MIDRKFVAAAALVTLLSACSADPVETVEYTRADFEAAIADPVKRSELVVKIMGSTVEEKTYTFQKFHVYGYTGENAIPFFTMNNLIVQHWAPLDEPGYYDLKHYEAAYYSEFDTATPIETWENPITGKVIDIPPFILGPVPRQYTPDGIMAPRLAPEPMKIEVIGERVFIPTQSIEKIRNLMSGPEWGPYEGPPDVYWDSMLTFAADIQDVMDPDTTSVTTDLSMQNLVSFSPYLRMGSQDGRTMVRAFGSNLESLDDLPPEIRAGLEVFTPEILNTDEWTELRIDSVDLMNEVRAKIESGEIEVEPMNELDD